MEKNDVATAKPDKTAELRAKLDGWRKTVDAQPPTPNPDYQP